MSALRHTKFTVPLEIRWWVSRAKENMAYKVKKTLTKGVKGLLKDQLIVLKNAKHEGMLLRRVEAQVEIHGEERLLVFITNNLSWSPRSVCDLYRRRWDIEVFFKQVKQTLKLSNFLGHSANAVRWQVYTALLVYVLLRFQGFLSAWAHSFTRLFAVVRSAVWERLDLLELLKSWFFRRICGRSLAILGCPALHYPPRLRRF